MENGRRNRKWAINGWNRPRIVGCNWWMWRVRNGKRTDHSDGYVYTKLYKYMKIGLIVRRVDTPSICRVTPSPFARGHTHRRGGGQTPGAVNPPETFVSCRLHILYNFMSVGLSLCLGPPPLSRSLLFSSGFEAVYSKSMIRPSIIIQYRNNHRWCQHIKLTGFKYHWMSRWSVRFKCRIWIGGFHLYNN